jgi:Na+-driven multidrug efflux pump
LTIFVAYIGPNEVVAWGILGSVWDTLEALTGKAALSLYVLSLCPFVSSGLTAFSFVEGFGDAGEIRVAYHMGSGKPATASNSSYKTILVGVIMATLLTSIMWMIGLDMAKWLTPDPTLQYLIAELLPLVGIGNIALTAGTVSWALVGAQGRYRLATLTAFVSSWCVTLPLAAIFTYGLNFDLQGVVASVVAGYSVTGTALLYILIRSDWERLSKIVVELNARDDDSSCSSSSSSDEDS